MLCIHKNRELTPGESWVRTMDPGNVLESSYVSLVGARGDDDADYRKIYGGHYDVLVELKRKYDPRNVFKYAVPRLFS